MHKRTKIIATIGPASKSLEVIHKLYKNGMNVVRVNMSHASIQDLNDISQIISKLNKKLKSSIGLMIDTQGPEIRTSNFKGSISLIKGDVVTLCSTIKNKSAKRSVLTI
jgi:pyruvate kinase